MSLLDGEVVGFVGTMVVVDWHAGSSYGQTHWSFSASNTKLAVHFCGKVTPLEQMYQNWEHGLLGSG